MPIGGMSPLAAMGGGSFVDSTVEPSHAFSREFETGGRYMANNLFIAYDLMYPGQNYEVVRDTIMRLGPWYQFQYSLFYVSSTLSAQQAHNAIRASMDSNDKLVVIDAAAATVSHYPPMDISAVNIHWFAP